MQLNFFLGHFNDHWFQFFFSILPSIVVVLFIIFIDVFVCIRICIVRYLNIYMYACLKYVCIHTHTHVFLKISEFIIVFLWWYSGGDMLHAHGSLYVVCFCSKHHA